MGQHEHVSLEWSLGAPQPGSHPRLGVKDAEAGSCLSHSAAGSLNEQISPSRVFLSASPNGPVDEFMLLVLAH